ncbi:MAG: hypothetical protein U0Z53_13145 [Blastocatellia bacterium]
MKNGVRTIAGAIAALSLLAMGAMLAGTGSAPVAASVRQRISLCAGPLVLVATFLLSVLGLYKIAMIVYEERSGKSDEDEPDGDSPWLFYVLGSFAAMVFSVFVFRMVGSYESLIRVLKAD